MFLKCNGFLVRKLQSVKNYSAAREGLSTLDLKLQSLNFLFSFSQQFVKLLKIRIDRKQQ